jgi:hypothetical protein
MAPEDDGGGKPGILFHLTAELRNEKFWEELIP